MKKAKLKLIILIFIVTSSKVYTQISTKVEFANAAREYLGTPHKVKSIDDDELKKTSHLMYLTLNYEKAYISKSAEVYFLRYNIFSDEMEFIKDNQIFDLNKNENQIIDFFNLKTKYALFKFEDKLSYFVLKSSGKNSVLVKQNVELEKGKKKITQFDVEVKPKFYKSNDDFYIAFNNTDLKIVPKNKNSFLNLFNEQSSQIKKFVNKNKLSHKNIDDLVKIVNYFNSLD